MTSVQSEAQDRLNGVLALLEGSARLDAARGPIVGPLAPDVQAWVADPEQGVVAAVEAVDGVDATRQMLASLASSELTVAAAVATDEACWAELTRRAGGCSETCIVGLTLNGEGLVRRLVVLRASLVPDQAVGDGTSAPCGQPILEAYLDDLMNSRFREAAAHFTVGAVYSHPPYHGGGERVLFRGREAIRRGFDIERGPSPARQVITGFWQRGDRVFIEGVVDGIPGGGTFVSAAQITSQSEIARYVAFYSGTRIPPHEVPGRGVVPSAKPDSRACD